MSEKNGQGNQQWTKGEVESTSLNKHQHQQIQQGVGQSYGANVRAEDLGLTNSVNPVFGSVGRIGIGCNLQGSLQYTSARFQAPPVDHHVPTGPSLSSHIAAQSSNSSMPVPSGFVPPPLSSSCSATTSVLTPNPFAVASLTGQNAMLAVPSHSHNSVMSTNQQFSQGLANTTQDLSPNQVHSPFGVEQLHHLNAQQHYELSKLMAASFGSSNQLHASTSGPTNLSSTAGSNISAANIQTESQSMVAVRQQTHSQPTSSNAVIEDFPSSASLGSINVQVAEKVIGTISSGTSASKLAVTPIHGRLMGLGIHTPDDDKLQRIQQLVESGVGEHAKQQIVQILDRISTLKPVEKLLLYLRLPGEQPETDPLRQPQNPLGTRSEINHTINWVRTHLEQDPQVSIPKQDVYNDYLTFCDRLDIKPLSTADFGKVMKQVFPGIRPRRLGTRGHSRYCYAAMRKTSKLPAPHLPTLSKPTTTTNNSGLSEVDLDSAINVLDGVEEDEPSWNIVKQWAENTLKIKVNDLKELAKHIKSNSAGIGSSGLVVNANLGVRVSSLTNKKCAQREPKEKRVMADMGPLKKRRKKKRKGSSSSESSYNPSVNVVADAQQQTPVLPQLSPANSTKSGSHNVLSPAIDDCQKSMNLANIKQEFIDSPGGGYPSPIASTDPMQQLLSVDNQHVSQYHSQVKHQHQQQIMPINLASETKGGVINSRPSSAVAVGPFEHARMSSDLTNISTTAVKNLTPKIMELSVENQTTSAAGSETVIKQEEIGPDDYNTSNIFCKKVRKAQQTKGYWVNSPTPTNRASSANLPIITTTASTPPPMAGSVITSPPNRSSNNPISSTGITTNYCMGPPAQIAPSTSPNNQSQHDDVPKVLSRNLQQLRAKKLLSAAVAVNCDPPDLSAVKEAADLPENLGLPRERVISICNMDKHELDDYFLPVEEENSEEQDNELLQYFQMGDAEEKLIKNSSSDAKRNSDPTVAANVTTSLTTHMAATATALMATSRTLSNTNSNLIKAERVGKNDAQNGKPCKQLSQQALNYLKSYSYPSLVQTKEQCSTKLVCTKTASTLTVGTASASLEPTTQKHQTQHILQHQARQQQQQKQPQPQPQPPNANKVANKRKINLNSSSSSDITAARKNYSFLPISPNINNTSSCSNTSNNTGFFASPGLSRLLTKQQSLDSDSSCDPMIGATRRRRTYMSAMTSASAPPSPSVLKQQQEQQILGFSHSILMDQWQLSNSSYNNSSSIINPNNALTVDQNSLDLDIFGGDQTAAPHTVSTSIATLSGLRFNNKSSNIENTSTNNCANNATNNNDGMLNDFTQRSRSVPLSQLQRSHSPAFNNTSFNLGCDNPNVYSACNSLVQTPVPSEFIDSVTMLSENSCSQHSTSIKLEEVGNVVGSDSTALLDEVDVSDILSSPDFVTKFSSLAQTGCGTKTTCSSAGSSSGYSSAGHFSLSLSSSYSNNGSGVNGNSSVSSSISRSVPSTPLPNQNLSNIFGNGYTNNFYKRRCVNNQSIDGTAENFQTVSMKYGYGNMSLSRSACDISKSMPSTPITTTPSNFRYSPSEFTRDFLINGNTIDDSLTSSYSTVTNENLIGSDVVGLDSSLLNADDSLVNGADSSTIAQGLTDSVVTPDYTVQSNSFNSTGPRPGGESSVGIGVGADILDSL